MRPGAPGEGSGPPSPAAVREKFRSAVQRAGTVRKAGAKPAKKAGAQPKKAGAKKGAQPPAKKAAARQEVKTSGLSMHAGPVGARAGWGWGGDGGA